jgi:hypothetical protein
MDRWNEVCRNKSWSDKDIQSFSDQGLYDENITYPFGTNILVAQITKPETAILYENWNVNKCSKYHIHLLHLYE